MRGMKRKLLVLCATTGTALLAVSAAAAWSVDMTAEPSLKRTHSWKIEKSASKSSVTLKKGESTTVSYSVTVGPAGAPVDSDWSVSGTMEMNDDANITVNSVVFTVIPAAPTNTPAIAATHSCVPVTFPVDLGIMGLECIYSASLPDAADRRARMFATATEDDGTTGVRNAFAPFSFASATVTEIDECVEVTDSMAGALGTVCVADAPKTFTYTKTIGPFMECGSKTVNNVASYKGVDSGASGSASASVSVTVTDCEPPKPGCTRTIGYWKNHAGFGPQADVVSPLLPVWLGTAAGAKSVNVTTAAKAVSLLKMEGSNGVFSASNGINKLYAQLLAAKLNGKASASLTPVAAVIAASDAFLAGNDSLSWSGLSMSQQGAVLYWAAKLDSYNNGDEGVRHCDDGHDEDECRDDKGGKDDKDGKYGKYGKGGYGGGDDCRDHDDDDHDHHDDDDHHDGDKCRGDDHKYRDGKGGGWR